MKTIKKSILLLLTLTAILPSLSFASSEDYTSVFYRLGQNYKKYIYEGIGNEQAKLRHISEMNRILGIERSESEIIDRLHTEKVLSREAERLGIYISDQEFNQEFSGLQSRMRQDSEFYSGILAFCEAAEISEDEYWEFHAPNYRMGWTIAKLRSTLREQFWADNPDIDIQKIRESFDEYYENYVNELKRKYEQEREQ